MIENVEILFCFLNSDIVEFDFIMQLGAFLAGALLAETNFRTQIEADIRPFRGLLLGLFFVTTGTSIDMQVRFINVLPNSTAMQIRERLMFEDCIGFYFSISTLPFLL